MNRRATSGVLHAAAVCAAALCTAAAAVAAPSANVSANDLAFERAARGVDRGGRLTVEGLLLAGDSGTSTLELARFEVWRANARVLVDGREVEVPTTAYFKGRVVGEEGSLAMLSVRERGGVQGLVLKDGTYWAVGKGRGQGGLKSRRADLSDLPPFECGLDGLRSSDLASTSAPLTSLTAAATVFDQSRVANLAIETDYEYYAKFGNTADALDYMGDLVGYADVVYSREIDTDMAIGFSRLWTGGSGSDPWTIGGCGSEPCGTDDALFQFRAHWNANMTGTARTIAHMLSGKSLGGGIAYLSVLCENYTSERGASEDYGLSASLSGSFNWDGDQAHNPSAVVWDVMVVLHEIGHNFSSPHSHDYCGYGGSSQPIDQCWDGCLGDTANALPSCSATPAAFRSGSGAGTIMSYCHQLSGSYGNIAMTFGEDHTCGVLPDREAAQMTSHAAARSGSYPSCFASLTCGNGAIDPGEDCDTGNLNGATCASEGFLGGTLACKSDCTFDTAQCTNCGNGTIDAGEICDGGNLNGASCSTLGCTSGVLACDATCTGYDLTLCGGCPLCNSNGLCEAGEDCGGCPTDCPGGTSSGGVCGNGVCEAGNGESCLTCAADCAGVQSGKPARRFCCGSGAGSNPVPCSDARCTTGGRSCTTIPVSPSTYCCGDTTCDAAEACATCALDCALGFELCGNAIDDDCNGATDCADSACSGEPSCACQGAGQSCSVSSECCSGNCRTKGKNAGTCA